jgi:hypothetical protein
MSNTVRVLVLLIFCLDVAFALLNFEHARRVATLPSSSASESLNLVQSWLVGTFSNKQQAESDALAGAPTAREGGHEYVSVTISRVEKEENMLCAAYYFGEDVRRVFRFRYYQLEHDEKFSAPRMRIHRPRPVLEEALKRFEYDRALLEADLQKPLQVTDEEQFEYLQGCDVVWTPSRWHFPFFWKTHSFEGVLAEGSCSICSQSDAQVQLVVKDNLRLTEQSLWINDRVYTTSGVQIIGNSKGIPYMMERRKEGE